MQKNILLTLEYKGTNYFGFQLQNKTAVREITVQEAIETALEKLFRKKIRIIFSGRTDRGAHAHGQCLNFPLDTTIPLSGIKAALNNFLPADIRVKTVKFVPHDFHARFDAKSKIYRYIICNAKEQSVFERDFSWHVHGKLCLDKIRQAAKKIIGKKDFSVFAKEAKRYEHCIRKVKKICIKKRGHNIIIDIEADGFLRSMARNIVSLLVKAGQGKVSITDIRAIVLRQMPYHITSAPAHGLYLWKVNY